MAIRKHLGRLLLAGMLLSAPALSTAVRAADQPAGYIFLSPLPGSIRVLPETNVILRPGRVLDPSLLTVGTQIDVRGSISGACSGRLRLSDDQSTVTFQPDRPFVYGEDVTVRVASSLSGDAGLPPIVFRFTIAGPERDALRSFRLPGDDGEDVNSAGATLSGMSVAGAATVSGTALVSHASGAFPSTTAPLPPDFPKITTTISGTPSPGRLFVSSFDRSDPGATPYLMILENDGTPFFYRPLVGAGHDFKLQPNGMLTYFDPVLDGFYALDSTYARVDSFRCGNGYQTDFHDCQVLPNGHVLLMSYDPEVVDMTPYDPKGHPDAVVIGLVIQEIDRDKNVVFQWRSWDHFAITDAVGIPLGGRTIDLIHGNSIDFDGNGDLLISSRNLNEITKISRATGDILWRLGGKNNQFQILNDPQGFSRQHAARFQPDGHITFFDNGTFRTPPYSRAVEYELDETKMVARLDWDYRHNPDIFGPFAGYVQRLSTGNTLVAWGVANPTLTEVTQSGKVVEELSLPQGVFSYRAFRFEWPPMLSALVDFSPRQLNTNITTGWLKATVDPVGFDPTSVVLSSVRLGGVVPPDLTGASGSTGAQDPHDLALAFDRALLTPLLTPTTTRLEVSGSLTNGQRFHGFGDVVVQAPMSTPAASLQTISPPGAVPVELVFADIAGAAAPRAVAVYDVRGRMVKRWTALVDPVGRLSWDGRRADGQRAAAGIYFVRVRSASGSNAVARIMLAR